MNAAAGPQPVLVSPRWTFQTAQVTRRFVVVDGARIGWVDQDGRGYRGVLREGQYRVGPAEATAERAAEHVWAAHVGTPATTRALVAVGFRQ